MARGVEFVKSVVDLLISKNTFPAHVLKSLSIISAGNGSCKAQFTVSDVHLNTYGTMHGGFTATVVDCVSSYALMTHPINKSGVSVDLHVTFMKAAVPGDVVTVDAKTLRAGKNLAYLTVNLTRNEGKDMVAHGQQTKYVGDK